MWGSRGRQLHCQHSSACHQIRSLCLHPIASEVLLLDVHSGTVGVPHMKCEALDPQKLNEVCT